MCGRGSYPAGALGATMELWFEMKLLEQTNLTRDGAWLDLVRTKQERLEMTQQKSEKKISKQRQRELENAAKKAHRRIIRERRKMRKMADKNQS